jgi:hypothetical protein
MTIEIINDENFLYYKMSDLNKTKNKYRWRPKSMSLRAEGIKPKPKSYKFQMKINAQKTLIYFSRNMI